MNASSDLQPHASSDTELLARFAAGDEAASRVFIRRFQARVYGVAVKLLGDHDLADDVAQEAFVRAWRKASSFDPRRGNVAGWLLRITHNLAVDELRRRRYETMEPEKLASVSPSTPGSEVEDAAAASADVEPAIDVLRRLPEPQVRALINMSALGRTATEVAEAEGIPVGTVKTRVRLGLRKLRDELLPLEAGSTTS